MKFVPVMVICDPAAPDVGLIPTTVGSTQVVDVWKDARMLGKAAGEAAMALCASPDIKGVPSTVQFASPGGNDMTSIFLTPQAITKENLNLVVEAGWIDEATLCAGVTAGSVAACP